MKNIISNKFLSYIIIVLLSLFVYFLGYLVRHYGLVLSFAFHSTSYFILTVILLKKYQNKLPALGIILAIIVVFVDIPMRIVDFKPTLITLPDLIGRLIAILFAYVYVKQKRILGKVITSVLVVSYIAAFSLVGYRQYYYYIRFGSLSGKIEQTLKQPLILQNSKGEDVLLSEMRGKYIVLDFWSSRCGSCYKQFPIVQTVFDKYKTTSNIDFYSVFLEWKGETIQTGFDILKERGCDFPVLSIQNGNPILKEIGVIKVPTVIIFDPRGKIIFRGEITSAMKVLEEISLMPDNQISI